MASDRSDDIMMIQTLNKVWLGFCGVVKSRDFNGTLIHRYLGFLSLFCLQFGHVSISKPALALCFATHRVAPTNILE